MKWGAIQLTARRGTQLVTKRKIQEIRHYPGTDKSDKFDRGKPSTQLEFRLLARGDTERKILESLIHDTQERDLELDSGYYYKRVVTGEGWDFRRIGNKLYEVSAVFTALDPTPYDSDTDAPLY